MISSTKRKHAVCSFISTPSTRTDTGTVFKEVWHMADLEPNAQAHYVELMEMIKRSCNFNRRDLKKPAQHLKILVEEWLEPPLEDFPDIDKAVARISPFFYPEFLESEDGLDFKDSLLFKQEERAAVIPDIRTLVVNGMRSQSFWN